MTVVVTVEVTVEVPVFVTVEAQLPSTAAAPPIPSRARKRRRVMPHASACLQSDAVTRRP